MVSTKKSSGNDSKNAKDNIRVKAKKVVVKQTKEKHQKLFKAKK